MKIDLSLLQTRYGFVPSFHDSHLMSITIDGTRVEGLFYLYEKPGENKPKQAWDDDLHVIATLEWQGVTHLDTVFEDNSLDSVTFVEEDGRVLTTLNRAWVSPPGSIVSDSVRAIKCEWATARFEGPHGQDISHSRFKFECKRT